MWPLVFTSLMTVLALASLSYLVSLYFKDASFADVIWGMFFVAIAIVLLLTVRHRTAVQYLDAALVCVWGIRLSWHVARRKAGRPEDWRYARWRKQWGENFTLLSLVRIFWLQGGLALIISASTIVAANAIASNGELHWWQLVGAGIWLIGFAFESIGDWQLSQFIKKHPKGDKIMSSGLWRYTRHPNYFGEVTQWWGLWLLVVALPNGWLALISPLTISFLILFVSGVPLLESKYKRNKAYQAYAKRTSSFLPLPPRQT